MTLARLRNMLAIPESPRDNSGDWSTVETALGVRLPSDYKEFIESYGSIYISNFLMLLNPFSENEHINLVRKQVAVREIYQALSESGERIPYKFCPEGDGLIVVGLTDNGDMIFWRTRSGNWTIAVNEARGPDWFEFDGGIVGFLEGLLSGDVDCHIFPGDAFKR